MAYREVPCKSCKQLVVWMKTKAGKMMPVDATSAKYGDDLYDASKGHISHFATCPFANDHRKRDNADAVPRTTLGTTASELFTAPMPIVDPGERHSEVRDLYIERHIPPPTDNDYLAEADIRAGGDGYREPEDRDYG